MQLFLNPQDKIINVENVMNSHQSTILNLVFRVYNEFRHSFNFK